MQPSGHTTQVWSSALRSWREQSGRKPLDEDDPWADSRAHRATCMAPHLIEKVGHGGREQRSARGGSISRPDGRRWQTFGRWAVQPRGRRAGTAQKLLCEERRPSASKFADFDPSAHDLGHNVGRELAFVRPLRTNKSLASERVGRNPGPNGRGPGRSTYGLGRHLINSLGQTPQGLALARRAGP